VAAENIDTRAVTLHIREQGAMRSVLSSIESSDDSVVDKARASVPMVGRDLASEVTCAEAYDWPDEPVCLGGQKPMQVVVCDFGVKRSILRDLASVGFSVRVVPAQTTASDVLAMKPDGVFLSNGPGDPEPVAYAAAAVKELVGTVPVFGICLGHQILGLALGGRTYKLKFGHHGSNHPVKDLATGRIEITAQNHGFCVDADSFGGHEVKVTHVNLNDQTVEGLELPKLRAFSAQFHPEAGPGPHDAKGIFRRFAKLVRGEKN
jgi:carbamoyl-phosphate synthase small subunit